MKKRTAILLCIVLASFLIGCGNRNTFRIGITVPAGSTTGFSYSEEEISPRGKTITVTSSDGMGDTELVLEPVEVKEENAYEPALLLSGEKIKLNAEKGAWFRLGIRLQNETDEDKTVFVEVSGVNVRITSATVGGDTCPAVCIDGVTYFDTGRVVPIEPDESAIEYVEMPLGGGGAVGTVKAFARIEEGKSIVCLIHDEWYEFLAEGITKADRNGAPPAMEFSTPEEAVQIIKEVQEAGAEKMPYPDDFKLYDKKYICLLKETPLPDFEQTAIMLVSQGIVVYYQNDKDSAAFYWDQGYKKTEELTERYCLARYEDTKFFFGEDGNDFFVYWWENGDQFCLRYPMDTNIPQEDIIENLEVVKYELR